MALVGAGEWRPPVPQLPVFQWSVLLFSRLSATEMASSSAVESVQCRQRTHHAAVLKDPCNVQLFTVYHFILTASLCVHLSRALVTLCFTLLCHKPSLAADYSTPGITYTAFMALQMRANSLSRFTLQRRYFWEMCPKAQAHIALVRAIVGII